MTSPFLIVENPSNHRFWCFWLNPINFNYEHYCQQTVCDFIERRQQNMYQHVMVDTNQNMGIWQGYHGKTKLWRAALWIMLWHNEGEQVLRLSWKLIWSIEGRIVPRVHWTWFVVLPVLKSHHLGHPIIHMFFFFSHCFSIGVIVHGPKLPQLQVFHRVKSPIWYHSVHSTHFPQNEKWKPFLIYPQLYIAIQDIHSNSIWKNGKLTILKSIKNNIKTDWWYTNPSEKWWSSDQLGWWNSQWKVIKFHGSSHHQPVLIRFSDAGEFNKAFLFCFFVF